METTETTETARAVVSSKSLFLHIFMCDPHFCSLLRTFSPAAATAAAVALVVREKWAKKVADSA